MKKLILMRHAEAENSSIGEDTDRNLTSKGIKQAEIAADFIIKSTIDKILVSPVKRVSQTLEIILNKRINVVEIEELEEIYTGPTEDIMSIIKKQDKNINTLMVIGHNPYIYKLATELVMVNSKDYEYIAQNIMSPAMIVIIEFTDALTWQDLDTHQGLIDSILK